MPRIQIRAAAAVAALSVALASCGASDLTGTSSTTGTATASTVAAVAGTGQTVAASAAATTPFTVQVANGSGSAVSGVAVTWAIAAGGGSLSSTSSTTDANGLATTTYTAGGAAGTATVTATVSGLTPVTFTATITATTATGADTSASTGGGTTTGSVSDSTQARVLAAITAFEATLSSTQLASFQIAFTQTLAARWSNLPCALSCRNGLLLGSLSSTQLAAALNVAKVALSDSGYARFQAIRAADSYLGQSANGYGEGNYVIAVLGTPSASSRWMLQLGGHHYAYNMSFNSAATPTVTTTTGTPFHSALEPQAFTLNGVSYAPLQARKVAVYTMINSLDATQKAAAQLSQTFDDMLLGPGKDWQFPAQQGVLVSSLSATQKGLVKTAIEQWVKDVPPAQATALLADYEADTSLAKTYVAWSKSTDSTVAGSYVRIDGPRVWIEFVCQNGVVFRSQIHFHTVWRDKLRDYGGQLSTASVEAARFAAQLAEARKQFAPSVARADEWLAAG